MTRFWYTTAETSSRQHLAADSLPAALLELGRRGVIVQAAGADTSPSLPRRRVRQDLLPPLYEQLAALLEQGVELSEALRRLALMGAPTRLARSLRVLAARVAEGYPLSEALEEQPEVYAALVTGTVAAGESYWPDEMPAARFYEPVERGLEIRIAERVRELRRLLAPGARPG